MSQSPSNQGMAHKAHPQAYLSHAPTYPEHHTSPLTYPFAQRRNTEHQGRSTNPGLSGPRSNYQMGQPVVQGRKIFGYEIFVDNDILAQLQADGDGAWFDKVKRIGQVESIKFNLDLNIPDLNGRNIQIYDKEMQKKYQSCQALLADIYQVFKKIRRENFSIIIFVPQGMVSLLIGTKGYQINKIMRESHTTIVVNQPINKMTYRTVKIQGYHSDIAKACRIIYEILQDKSSIAYSIEKEPSQLDYSKARVKTKFILCTTVLNYLMNKKKGVIKRIEDETKCTIKFKEDTSSRLLKREEELCVLLGRLQDVQAFFVMLINLMQIYYDQDKKGHDYIFKMLIPSNYVTKLIGQKGYMIRDITQRSGGAQIKILSDRQSQRDARECIISINGTRENKIDATCLILEQIQCFKNGGPILQSGKSINENLAQQFKNSLPLHKGQDFFQDGEMGIGSKLETQEKIIKESENLRPNLGLQADNHGEEGLISAEQEQEIKQDPVHVGTTLTGGPIVTQPTADSKQEVKQLEENLKSLPPSLTTTPNTNPIPTPAINPITPSLTLNKQVMENEGAQSRPPNTAQKQKTSQKQSSSIRHPNTEERKLLRSPSRRSGNSGGSSPSRSRNKPRRGTDQKGGRSSSSSSSYQQDKQYVQVKLVIPKRLAQDHKQLKYIESLCHSQISVREQRVQGSSESIISIRGSLRNNSQCIKMLQKRILRLTMHSSTR